LVYDLQFGVALCAGRVNGCEIVQQLPLQLFAGSESAATGLGSPRSRCEKSPRPV
jgi:hypothetical protein